MLHYSQHVRAWSERLCARSCARRSFGWDAVLRLAHIKSKRRIFFRAMATIFQIERMTVDGGGVPSNLVFSTKGLFLEEKVQAHFRSLSYHIFSYLIPRCPPPGEASRLICLFTTNSRHIISFLQLLNVNFFYMYRDANHQKSGFPNSC